MEYAKKRNTIKEYNKTQGRIEEYEIIQKQKNMKVR
jgi:hypothetical protein